MTKNSKPIKILFDAVPLAQANRTGVGRTEVGLIEALAKQYPDDIELVGHYFDFMWRKGKSVDLPRAKNIRYRRTCLLPGRIFNMLRRLRLPVFYELLVKERGDFILFPNFLGWPSLFNTPSAPYVHDVTFIDYPEYVRGPNLFDLKTLVPKTLKRSSFTITNSQSSKSGIQKTYPWYTKPFLVVDIPLVEGVTVSQAEANKLLKDMGITKPFILAHGTLEPRKNLVNLMDAYSKLSKELRDTYSLVLSGGKGWNDNEILSTLATLQSKGFSIIQTGYISNEQRAALFMNTTLYTLISHYEGYGMQLMEAMVYRSPILASDIPVLREIGGDAALYCNTDSLTIQHALTSYLTAPSQKDRDVLLQQGGERIRLFSWEKVATQLYEAIDNTVNQNT